MPKKYLNNFHFFGSKILDGKKLECTVFWKCERKKCFSDNVPFFCDTHMPKKNKPHIFGYTAWPKIVRVFIFAKIICD